jgi:hypothetical protein
VEWIARPGYSIRIVRDRSPPVRSCRLETAVGQTSTISGYSGTSYA